MDRSCGVSLRQFGWLICLAGCANYSLRAPALREESLAPALAASGAPNSSEVASNPTATASVGADAAGTAASLTSGGRRPAAPGDPQDMPAVLAELEALGAIDAPTRERLVADLKKTDPALWPQLVSYFKASLAYRQKYGTDEAAAQGVDSQGATAVVPMVKPPAVATQVLDEPALLPGVPSAKPALAARPTVAAGATTAGAATPAAIASTPIARDTAISDPAVQSAAYEVVAAGPERTAPAAPTSGATSGASTANTQPIVSDPAPVAAAPTANSSVAATGGASAASLPTTVSPPAVVAAVGTKPASPAAAAETDPLDWRGHLKAAIRGLERETVDPPATTAAIGRHASLRLLYLVDSDRDGALRPLSGISATQQDFWSQQLFGLSTYLDAERTPDDARRAAAAAVHLRDANLKLGDMATLSVRNLAFATEVHSYGVYKKFDRYEFHSGQEVLLYAEVENFKSAATDQGFHTALRSSYQILDNRGARVDQKEFEITEEHCLNPRRDYFIRYFVWMPKRIYGGTYTLQLTIEDTLSQKIGQASIEFTVADKE